MGTIGRTIAALAAVAGASAWPLAELAFAADAAVTGGEESKSMTLQDVRVRLNRESGEAYNACRFSALSKDYFLRFSRDPSAKPGKDEIEIDASWSVAAPDEASDLAVLMIRHFRDFMGRRMAVVLDEKRAASLRNRIVFSESGGGIAGVADSFTISVKPGLVTVRGADAAGLRDGIVRLVDMMGFREAPILKLGQLVCRPRLPLRLGAVPRGGSWREAIFLGYNAVLHGGGDLYALSDSKAIPELAVRQAPGLAMQNALNGAELRRYGLKAYGQIGIRRKFPKDDPVFLAHPDIRGALTWTADGEYVLCTEHPLVKQYLRESIQTIFRADPKLDGLFLIVGGESFYHCFMRPFGVEKGHTNCGRCEKLGADTAVANLLNLLAGAARQINPKAEIIAWPYSAEHVWSADRAQSGMISKMGKGTGLFTEMEKDEYVAKPDGVNKHLWDYSIDMTGPGDRAKQQIAACRKAGIPIFLKSEPEIGYEAPRLPHIPCMDRWADRAEALASCGADGAWVFPSFRPNYGTSAAEIFKFFWWNDALPKDELLLKLAGRIGGAKAAPHIRRAWRLVSEAIDWSPELPPYYTGPYYLGPAHPMCADLSAKLPDVFYGHYLYMAELKDADGLAKRPTFLTSARGDAAVFGKFYRKMDSLLTQAAQEMDACAAGVNGRHKLMFDAEMNAVKWFHFTARTHANFYESCMIRDRLGVLAEKAQKTPDELAEAKRLWTRWRAVLLDERDNTRLALPVVEGDMRLDCYFGGDHTFPHAADMIRAKLLLLRGEIEEYLPALAGKIGIDVQASAPGAGRGLD
ncbi:MAG: hypothetical protein GX608_03135 [Lentisphaerae bacterium]|nr:hypothetical protein [Lentisphaerota bacterium]